MSWKYWRNTRRLSAWLIFKTNERIPSDWDFWRERGRDPELLKDDLGFDAVAFAVVARAITVVVAMPFSFSMPALYLFTCDIAVAEKSIPKRKGAELLRLRQKMED
ncbi:hypothetical protein ACFX2B_013678 [Malus domestica]